MFVYARCSAGVTYHILLCGFVRTTHEFIKADMQTDCETAYGEIAPSCRHFVVGSRRAHAQIFLNYCNHCMNVCVCAKALYAAAKVGGLERIRFHVDLICSSIARYYNE